MDASLGWMRRLAIGVFRRRFLDRWFLRCVRRILHGRPAGRKRSFGRFFRLFDRRSIGRGRRFLHRRFGTTVAHGENRIAASVIMAIRHGD
jgi:hypothetical protein